MLRQRLLWFAPRFILTLLLVALLGWLIASYVYVIGLTLPGCTPSAKAQDGYQSIQLHTSDGITVQGWWRSPTNGAVIILLGGLGMNRDALLPEAEMLARHGYGILLTDLRQCAGQYSTLGDREIAELQAAVDYARSQEGVARVGVLGFSIGAVTTVRGAARFETIDAIVAMGDYYNMWGEINGSQDSPLTWSGLFARGIGLVLWLRNGAWPGEISPIDDLPLIAPRPVFLIYGEREAQRTHAEAQYFAAGEPKQLWIVPGADHGGYYQIAPAEFEQRVAGFFDQYLLK